MMQIIKFWCPPAELKKDTEMYSVMSNYYHQIPQIYYTKNIASKLFVYVLSVLVETHNYAIMFSHKKVNM